MVYPAVFLIHTINAIHRTPAGTVDRYGNPEYTETTTAGIRARLTSSATAGISTDGYTCTAKATITDAAVELAEDDRIKTDTAGFSAEYWINHITAVYEPTTATVSHRILELRETPERERNE